MAGDARSTPWPEPTPSDAAGAGRILVAVSGHGLSERVLDLVARLAGTGEGQRSDVLLVRVAKVWGTGLGIQHPALQPNTAERSAAQETVAGAAQALRERGVAAEGLVVAGRDEGRALAREARRAAAAVIVVGRSDAGLLARLLRGPDPARVLLARARCTLVVAEG